MKRRQGFLAILASLVLCIGLPAAAEADSSPITAIAGPGNAITFTQNGAPPQVLNCDLTDALTNWAISVTTVSPTGFTVLATGKAGGPAAGRSVQLLYSRTAPPVWTEN